MGLGISAVKLNLELWRRGLFNDINHVIEMGSQELHLKLTDFQELIQTAGVPGYNRDNFLALDNWPAHPRLSARHLYQLLGIKEYSCVDLNEVYGALPIDLNCPLEDKSLYGKYDMVTDHGTNEHVFNIGETYRTVHRLCRPGGLIVIFQSMMKGNGYYLFDAPFFEGLAAANKYTTLFSSYDFITHATTTSGSSDQYLVPLSHELLEMMDWSKTLNIAICYVFRKESNADFVYPKPGGSVSELQRRHRYPLQTLQIPPSPNHSFVPIFPESIHGKDLVAEAKDRVRRKITSCLSFKK